MDAALLPDIEVKSKAASNNRETGRETGGFLSRRGGEMMDMGKTNMKQAEKGGEKVENFDH